MPSYCDSFKHVTSGNVDGRMWLMLHRYVLCISQVIRRTLRFVRTLQNARILFPVRVALKLEHAPSVTSVCNKQDSTERDIPAFVTKCLWSFVLMKPIHHLNNHQDDPELSDHHPSLPSCLASEHNRTRPPCYHSALTLSITHTCWL
jgi:hypothetical protein